MSRLLSTIQNDIVIQVRKNFYTVTMILALLFAVIFSLILRADQIRTIVPAAMLLIVGGTTMLFIGALILEEKEKGILKALLLSPLGPGRYLMSKVVTITFLSTLEIGIMIGGPIAYFHASAGTALPSVLILSVGVIVLNLIYTLLGLAITVRFRKVTDYMIPVVVVMILLQAPILYFTNIVPHPALLAIPSSVPVMMPLRL